MGIDELDINRVAEKNAQRRLGRYSGTAATAKAPGIDAGMQQHLAKMRAADTAAAERIVSGQRPATPAATTPAAGATPPAAGRLAPVRGAISKGANIVSKGARLVGRTLPVATAAIDTALDIRDPSRVAGKSDNTGTGIDSLVATGNNLLSGATLGIVPPESMNDLTRVLRGTDTSSSVQLTDGAKSDIATLGRTGINLQSEDDFTRARSALGKPEVPPAPSNNATQAVAPAVYRHGNQFSDTPIPGGTTYARARETSTPAAPVETQPIASGPQPVAAAPRSIADLGDLARAERQSQRDEGVQRERDSFNTEQMRRALVGGVESPVFGSTAASEQANARKATLRLLQEAASGRGSVSAKGQQAAIQALADFTKGGGGRDTSLVGGVTPTGRSGAAVRAEQAQADQAEQEGIAAGIATQQAARQQQISDQLGQIGTLPPEQRRALIDRALVSQGKDPDASRYESIEDIVAYDQFNTPIKARGLFDTHTQQRIGGGQAPAVGNGQSAPASFDQFVKEFRQDPRAKNYSDEEIKALYNSRYGNK